MAFRVKDAAQGAEAALERGAKPISGPVGPMELNIPAIEGIGGSNLYLVDRYGAQEIYDVDFVPLPGADAAMAANSAGLHLIDHLTHNVYRGRMAHLGRVLRAHLQLPRDPLLRHRGRAPACSPRR